MVSPLALAGISTAFGLIQSLTKRSDKGAETAPRQANFAEQVGQNLPSGPQASPPPGLAELFARFDADKSGGLSKSEFEDALAQAQEKAKGLSGAFSRETYGALLAVQEQMQKGKSSSDLLDKVMARFDTDGNGTISQDELLKGLPTSTPKQAKKDGLEALFNSMDRDGDGKISLDEMKIALQSMREERRRERDGHSTGTILTGSDVAAASTQGTAAAG